MEALKFSRSKLDERAFAQILGRSPKGVTVELARAAAELVSSKLTELTFNDPKLARDGFLAFKRIAQSFPSAVCIVMREWTEGTVDPDEVAPDYIVTEAA